MSPTKGTLWFHFQRVGGTSRQSPGKTGVGPFSVEIDLDDPAAIEHAIGVEVRRHAPNVVGALRFRIATNDPSRPEAKYFYVRDSVTGVQVAHGPAQIRRAVE